MPIFLTLIPYSVPVESIPTFSSKISLELLLHYKGKILTNMHISKFAQFEAFFAILHKLQSTLAIIFQIRVRIVMQQCVVQCYG